MKKLFNLFVFLLLLPVAVYFARDTLLKVFLGPYLTQTTGFSIKVATIKTTWRNGFDFGVAMNGTCAGAPLSFHGELDIKKQKLTEHQLSIVGFPLKNLNWKVRSKTGFEFTQGNVDVSTTGSASVSALNLRANLLLKDYLVKATKEELIPFKAGLANYFLKRKNRFPLNLKITGTPSNPIIHWPPEMKRHLAEEVINEIRNLEPVKKLEAKIKAEVKEKMKEVEEELKKAIPEELQETLNPLKDKIKNLPSF